MPTTDLRMVPVDGPPQNADSEHVLDDDDVVGVLALSDRNTLEPNLGSRGGLPSTTVTSLLPKRLWEAMERGLIRGKRTLTGSGQPKIVVSKICVELARSTILRIKVS
ncbi:hypothetical protein PQX77_006771 [Marasmius sp. AFHP31]|nr:hypothetical protein PQX77_006771 [Marasmius sp. AFHP31]